MNNATREIIKALKGKIYNGYGIAFCPCHNNTRTPALTIKYDDYTDKILVKCHAGCDNLDILRELGQRGFLQGTSHLYDYPKFLKPKEIPLRKQEWDNTAYIQSIIAKSYPIENSLAEHYLRHIRKISCGLSHSLKFHPSLKHTPTRQFYPVMIGLVTDFTSSNVKAIHRTYLSPSGYKANIEPNKMMLGNVCGGGVFIANSPNMVLIVAEGIETALSLKCFYPDTNIIATLSTAGMKNLILPQPAGKLIVAIDNDTAGILAGESLANRAYANGWHVETIKPPKGQDFNDVLMNKTNNSEILL